MRDIDNKYRAVLLKIGSQINPPKDAAARKLILQNFRKLLYKHCSDENLFIKYYAIANAKKIHLDGDFITLLWCKSNNSNVRKLLLSDHKYAISSGSQKYGTPSFEDFLTRFSEDEQAKRTREIQEVKAYHLIKNNK